MKFQQITADLESFASARGGEVFGMSDGSLVRVSVVERGEVTLTLWLALYRANGHSPAYLRPSLTLHCARLCNKPVDDSLLQSLEGIPKEQVDSLVASRRRENGHVPFPPNGERHLFGHLLAEAGPLGQWNQAQFIEHLSRVFDGATQLAEQSSWPGHAEEFLSWLRLELSGLPWLANLAESWSVAPKA